MPQRDEPTVADPVEPSPDDEDEDEEDKAYWAAIENSPEFIASIARGRADAAAGRGISGEELLRQLEERDAAGKGDGLP